MPSLEELRKKLREGASPIAESPVEAFKKRKSYGWKPADKAPFLLGKEGKPIFYSYDLEVNDENNPYLTIYIAHEKRTGLFAPFGKVESEPDDITDLITLFQFWESNSFQKKRSYAQDFCSMLPFDNLGPGITSSRVEFQIQIASKIPEAAWKAMSKLLRDAALEYPALCESNGEGKNDFFDPDVAKALRGKTIFDPES